jgi:hypothetical protein
MDAVDQGSLPDSLALEGLFSRNGYRPMMALKRLKPDEYFANHGPSGILPERAALLESRPHDFVREPSSRADCAGVIRFAGSFAAVNGARTFRELGATWEPDFVLLRREDSARIIGGCVCFPTGWSLEEKQDHSLFFAHAPVPGLNSQLGPSVEGFFAHLKPQECYQRSNWSLTSSNRMNQRPQEKIPEIESTCDPEATFLRVEWQALASIDDIHIIFGIRIYHLTLESIRRQRGAAHLLAENLSTMPEEMLSYKRLSRCRDRIVQLLS